MNKKQLIVMWCVIGVIVLAGLFHLVKKPNRRLEFGFLFDDYQYLEFTLILMIMIWILAALVTVGLVITFKDKSKGKNTNIRD